MRETTEGPGLPAELSAKLDRIRNILTDMSAEERARLGGSPQLVEETFGVVRCPPSDKAKALAATYVAGSREFPPHGLAVLVEETAEQREAVRKLQAGMLERGEAAEKAALLKIRGNRIDPFPDSDPEPSSEREE